MISEPNNMEQDLIFKALVHMIDTNSGTGFQNVDQGHPAYIRGAKGKVGGGDSPIQNVLFKLLNSFDRRFHEEGPDLSTWQKFCAFAVAAQSRQHGC